MSKAELVGDKRQKCGVSSEPVCGRGGGEQPPHLCPSPLEFITHWSLFSLPLPYTWIFISAHLHCACSHTTLKHDKGINDTFSGGKCWKQIASPPPLQLQPWSCLQKSHCYPTWGPSWRRPGHPLPQVGFAPLQQQPPVQPLILNV